MRWWGRRLLEVVLLVAIGTVAGLALNAARRDPLPYDLPASLLLTESGTRVILPPEAERLYTQAAAVFVDARAPGAFIAGHIEGALGLAPDRFAELYPELELWSGGMPLILYGERGNVLAPDDLAMRLREAGQTEVVLLGFGFEGWQARGFPTASGPEGLLGTAPGSAGGGQ